jgi:hypothetical protein
MHAALKVIVGLILILIGLGLFVESIPELAMGTYTGINWLSNFVIVVTGVIPIFLIVVGLFVVWLEVDEMKAQKEIKAETKKPEKKKK